MSLDRTRTHNVCPSKQSIARPHAAVYRFLSEYYYARCRIMFCCHTTFLLLCDAINILSYALFNAAYRCHVCGHHAAILRMGMHVTTLCHTAQRPRAAKQAYLVTRWYVCAATLLRRCRVYGHMTTRYVKGLGNRGYIPLP